MFLPAETGDVGEIAEPRIPYWQSSARSRARILSQVARLVLYWLSPTPGSSCLNSWSCRLKVGIALARRLMSHRRWKSVVSHSLAHIPTELRSRRDPQPGRHLGPFACTASYSNHRPDDRCPRRTREAGWKGHLSRCWYQWQARRAGRF